MIRRISNRDKVALTLYLSNKLRISLPEANSKVRKILKTGICFIKEEKDLTGVCWIESRLVGEKKEKFIEILCNNWRLAEDFIQVLRWNLNGIYFFALPKHDFLNRTFNKNGIRFQRVDGDKNIYNYKFELRNFVNYKSEDNED